MQLKYIKSIGAEFEGGGPMYLERLVRSYDPRVSIGTDGSVDVNCWDYFDGSFCESTSWVNNYEIRLWSYDPMDLQLFADLLWSNGFRQNSSCGNHMHFRFSTSFALYLLSDYDFVEYYVARYKRQFRNRRKYLRRLDNRYSAVYESENDFIANVIGVGSRYHVINFVSLYEPQKTLEIRVMPYAESAEEWAQMLEFNINVIESYIDAKLQQLKHIETDVSVETAEEEIEGVV